MNVPKLRFKEFNDEWKNIILGDNCSFFSGGTPASNNKLFYNGNIPFIRSGEIHSNTTELFINEDALKNSSAKMISKNDLILALYGATSGEVDLSKIDGAINQAILCIRPFNVLDKNFLKNFFVKNKSTILNKYLQGGQGNLSAEIIKKINCNIPTIKEQKKIGTFLSLLDKKIELQSKKIEALKLYKKGLSKILLNQNCNDEFYLRDIAFFENGKGHENLITENGNYILVNSKFISTNGEIIKKCDRQLTPLYVGDITMVMSDLPNGKALAKCFYINEDNKYTLNQRICLLRTRSNVNAQYLYYKINRNPYYLKFDDGVNQTNLKKEDILNLQIKLPSIEYQDKFAKILSTFDKKIIYENDKLSKLESLKKGLMQNMFI